MSKFKVGQVWRDGWGKEVVIASLDSGKGGYPILDSDGFTYTEDGAFTKWFGTDYDLVELVRDVDGWIHWYGGECPVPSGAIGEVRFRNGYVVSGRIDELTWGHAGRLGDIFAYRLKETKGEDVVSVPTEAGGDNRKATRDELELFDSLVKAAVARDGASQASKEIWAIKAIIQARRAL